MRIGWVVLLGSVLSTACGGPLPEQPTGQAAPGEVSAPGFDSEDAAAPGQDEVSAEWNQPRPRLGPAFLVKDIVPGANPGAGLPRELVDLGGRLFFVVTAGGELTLWRSDGTAPGTVPIVYFPAPPLIDERSSELTVVGDRLFFVVNSHALWVSDGTVSGTRLVKDPFQGEGGPMSGSVHALVAVGDALFFIRDVSVDGTTRSELWRSDGTPSGTVRVRALGTGFVSSLTVLGRKVFFSTDDGVHGEELWVSDGTDAGTRLVKDINPGAASSSPLDLTPGDGELFFSATEPEHGRELWRTDGTAAGTRLLEDLAPGPASSEVVPFRVFEGRLYFSMRDEAHDTFDLMKVRVDDSHHHRPVFLATLAGDSSPFPSTFLVSIGRGSSLVTGGRLYLSVLILIARIPNVAHFWVTNGTPCGTRFLGSSMRARRAATGEPFAAVGDGRIVFPSTDEAHGEELWESDGTARGTRLLQDIVPGPLGSGPISFRRSDGFIFFVADTPETGPGLWALPLPREG